MKARSLLSALLLLGLSATAQRTISLPDVTTTARVPMNRIGLTETRIDSTALKENIALSMADVLAYNSGLFVKNHGRATLSTVSFRGTSPSHTAVSWNGMDINSPMLGSTDFSLIPAFFIDGATLLHGSSSVGSTGGGLGGAIELDTKPNDGDGLALQYVQGIGSFSTFDEYLRVAYGHDRWHLSTRAVVSTSPNDYTYRNRDKKENIYDENHQIIGQYYPKERNVSGAFRDLHLLQEAYYDAGRRGELSVKLWWAGTNRELPLLTTDYSDPSAFENRQRENTFRG
ncbi:MAG: Plug domain-containing protein, partial [Paramuribaculum sp.]|nr:Plug domain-containing protein [Paramuribaculum sp.]